MKIKKKEAANGPFLKTITDVQSSINNNNYYCCCSYNHLDRIQVCSQDRRDDDGIQSTLFLSILRLASMCTDICDIGKLHRIECLKHRIAVYNYLYLRELHLIEFLHVSNQHSLNVYRYLHDR